MVRPLYTKLLAQDTLAFGTLTGSPPTGTIWDIRDIAATTTRLSPYVGGWGFTLSLDGVGGFPLWRVVNVPGGVTLRWYGRQVMEPGDSLFANSLDDWTYWITGYQLTAP